MLTPSQARHKRFLEAIYHLDQDMRMKVHHDLTPEKIAGFEKIDLHNQNRISRYLTRYGWPDQNIYGEKASNAVFLVIQHAAKEYIEAHIHYLRDAVCQNKTDRTNLAFMQDRLLLYRGKKQIFGTQYMREEINGLSRFIPKPLGNPAFVNQRRTKAGFQETIEDYLQDAMAFVQSVKK